MKIDMFCHIIPEKYDKVLSELGAWGPFGKGSARMGPEALRDLDLRFGIMDRFEDMRQVPTLGIPAIEQAADSEKSVDLAKAANDDLAELVARYPDRFVAAVAVLPMNNLDAAWKELDRAINDLKLKGVLVYSSINDKPLDSPEFLPLYEKMSQYDLPIWIHPTRNVDYADYRTETESLYHLFGLLGWPHETTIAMARLSYSGILEKYPNLKIITHHCGGTVPCLAGRITELGGDMVDDAGRYTPLTKTLPEYLKMFYGDTATYASPTALMCGYEFFGAEHMLLGTDMPHTSSSGLSESGIRLAISGIDQMEISALEKKMIYEDNARRLLHLP